MRKLDINKLILESNWDVHKICHSIIVEILNLADQEQLKDKSTNIQDYKVKCFDQIIHQINDQIDQYAKNENKLEQQICKLAKHNLSFHQSVASYQYTYSVIPVLELGYQVMNLSDIDIDYLSQVLQECKNDTNLSDKGQLKYHAVMLVMAYINIQQQKFGQAFKFLEKLATKYTLDNEQVEEMTKKKVKTDTDSNLEEQKEEEEEIKKSPINYSISQKQKFKYGFIESIITFQALQFIYQNNLNQLEHYVKKLSQLQNEISQFEGVDEIKDRVNKHIKLFLTHQYFMQKCFPKAKQTLSQLSDRKIEEALLIFFNNQNKHCLRNMETIYYNLFSDDFFQIFRQLQELERKTITSQDIERLCQFYKESTKKDTQRYQYGRGVILLLLVISSRLLRIGKKYEESQKQMEKMFALCNITSTKFSDSLELFFKYDLLLPYLYQKVQNPSDEAISKYTIIDEFKKTGISELKIAKIKGDQTQFVLKTIRKNSSLQVLRTFDILNEICLSMLMSHRNILKVYDVYLDNENDIVLVSKRQGQNLKDLLKNRKISQKKRLSYVLQIINAFIHMHSLNIIHTDLKLENIVTLLDNIKKIKIIDLGFAQVKLFNKYFKPSGTTIYFAPSEITSNQQFCTFESDIYMIGRAIKCLLLDIQETDIIKPNQSEFLISEQFKFLVEQMTREEIHKRWALNIVTSEFKKDLFILKIFKKIQKQLQNLKQSQIEIQTRYQEFVNHINNQFTILESYIYKTCYVDTNNIPWSPLDLNMDQNFNITSIYNSIAQLINKDDFLDCLMDQDIINFVREVIVYVNKQNQEQSHKIEFHQVEIALQELRIRQKQEDKNSKNDILPEYQKKLIDYNSFTLEQRGNVDLKDIYINIFQQINFELNSLNKEFKNNTLEDLDVQIYNHIKTEQFSQQSKIFSTQGYNLQHLETGDLSSSFTDNNSFSQNYQSRINREQLPNSHFLRINVSNLPNDLQNSSQFSYSNNNTVDGMNNYTYSINEGNFQSSINSNGYTQEDQNDRSVNEDQQESQIQEDEEDSQNE